MKMKMKSGKRAYDRATVKMLDILNEGAFLSSSIRVDDVDVTVEDWKPVQDENGNEFFKVTFE